MNYNKQKRENILAFVHDEGKYGNKFKCLQKIEQAFKKNGVRWGLTCSAALFFDGIVDDFDDYDIVIDKEDVAKAVEALESIGQKEVAINKSCFKSNYYGEYSVEGIGLDVIGNFGVITYNAQYVYDFKSKDVTMVKISDDFEVPIIPEEAQWLLYAMMVGWQPQRIFKKELIGQYLRTEGIRHKNVFEEALNQFIPYWLKAQIKEFI